jgi:hypothetical protein
MVSTNLYSVDGQLLPATFCSITSSGIENDYLIEFFVEQVNSYYTVWYNSATSRINAETVKHLMTKKPSDKVVCKVDYLLKSDKNKALVLRAKKIVIDGFKF